MNGDKSCVVDAEVLSLGTAIDFAHAMSDGDDGAS